MRGGCAVVDPRRGGAPARPPLPGEVPLAAADGLLRADPDQARRLGPGAGAARDRPRRYGVSGCDRAPEAVVGRMGPAGVRRAARGVGAPGLALAPRRPHAAPPRG